MMDPDDEREPDVRFTFAGETPTSTPKLLRFTYPRLRAQHDLEIVFRDVPLTVGRPEYGATRSWVTGPNSRRPGQALAGSLSHFGLRALLSSPARLTRS